MDSERIAKKLEDGIRIFKEHEKTSWLIATVTSAFNKQEWMVNVIKNKLCRDGSVNIESLEKLVEILRDHDPLYNVEIFLKTLSPDGNLDPSPLASKGYRLSLSDTQGVFQHLKTNMLAPKN